MNDYYDDDYMTEAYGPTARDAALFGETDHITQLEEEGQITEAQAREMLTEIYARYETK